MSDPNKQQIGDGSDNFGQAAQKAAEAAKKLSSATAQKATAATAEATSTAASASVSAASQAGQAAAGAAAGAATAGVGAIIVAAWSMRHTLFKILICVCLILVFLIAAIVSLPSIVFNQTFRTDPYTFDPYLPTDPHAVYLEMSASVSACIANGHTYALSRIERIISDGGFDHALSMEVLINHAPASAGYDVSYILAAYSASMGQRGTTRGDMQTKLCAIVGQMFPVTYVIRETQRTVLVITYDEHGTQIITEQTETVRYIEATIHPFNQSAILAAFSIDPDAVYGIFNITYAEAIRNMSIALRRTIYGTIGGGDIPPLTDAELIAFLNELDTTAARRELIRVSLSLVGRVPYFWGGKSGPGWNDAWNTPRRVTAPGSRSTGTIRPFGLDCSGFVDWAYHTTFGRGIPGGTWHQWYASYAITAAELQPGDLGFIRPGGAGAGNHVLIYAGTRNGQRLWIHSAGRTGVIMNTPNYAIPHLRRARGFDLDSNIPPISALQLRVEDTLAPIRYVALEPVAMMSSLNESDRKRRLWSKSGGTWHIPLRFARYYVIIMA